MRFKLTPAAACQNEGCAELVYAELRRSHDFDFCLECEAAYLEVAGDVLMRMTTPHCSEPCCRGRQMFKRSGGRLPPRGGMVL